MIYVKYIINTVEEHKEDSWVENYEGLTIAEIAPANCSGAIYNNKPVSTDSEEFDAIVVEDDTSIIFVYTDKGVETIIVAAIVAELVKIGVGATLATVIATTVVSVVSLGTLYLGINALLPKAPGLASRSDEGSNSNFGFSIQNVVGNNIPIPVVYGEMKCAGALAQVFTRYNSLGDSVIYYVLVLSEGRIDRIGNFGSDQNNLQGATLPDDLFLNDIAAKDLEELEVSLRMGTLDQTVMPNFENQVIQYGQNFTMSTDNYFVWTTKDACTSVEFNILFPSGLRRIHETSGENRSVPVAVLIKIYNESGTVLIREDFFEYWNKLPLSFGFTRVVDFPEYGKYQVHIAKISPDFYLDFSTRFDQMILESVNEVRPFTIAHRGRALLGVKLRASDQISGGLPKTTIICKGRRVLNPVTGFTQYTRNNAWILRDWLLDKKYGLGNRIKEQDIDDDAFADFADRCDELIDPWTDAPITSAPVPDAGNEGSGIPVISGSWASTTVTGKWVLEITSVDTGVEVGAKWTFKPDYEYRIPEEEYTTVHTNTTPQTVAYGMLGELNPGLDWVVGDFWEFRVLKEPRHRLDLQVDQRIAAYEIAQDMAKSGRSILFPIGSVFTVDSLGQKVIDGGVFSENANIKKDTLIRSAQAPTSRFNVIDIEFVSSDLDYEKDSVIMETEGVSDEVYEEQKLSIRMIGVTRRTEANRFADFYRRIQTQQRYSVQFTAGIDAITLMPGRVFKLNTLNRVNAYTGRVGTFEAGTSIDVDVEGGIELTAGVVYAYTERRKNNSASTRNFTVPTTGTYTTIPVAPFDTDPVGNPFIIGMKASDSELYMCDSISSADDVTEREITGVLYTDEIFSDDAPPVSTYREPLDLGDPPANVTNLTTTETETTIGESSQIVLNWDASAGEPEAIRYRIFATTFGGGFTLIGEVSETTFTDNVQYNTGVVVTYAIQPVSAKGARRTLSNVTQLDYSILRYFTLIIDFPGDVPSGSITPTTGNNATLSWDAVTGADGYEVRRGGWHDAPKVYVGTSTSCPIKLDNIDQDYFIRAYIFTGTTPFYSPNHLKVTSGTANLGSYTTEEARGFFTFLSEGTVSNGTVVDWKEYDAQQGVLGTVPWLDSAYTSPSVDLGTTADTHVSWDIRSVPYQIDEYSDLNPTMLHKSFYGDINANYMNAFYFVQVSNDNVNWGSVRLDNQPVADIVLNARYFRFVTVLQPIRQTLGPDWPCLGMLERLRYAFYR